MKAMMKGKAAQFFKKPQKKQINPDQLINEAQAKSIANIIGIQQQQIQTFQWFFQQIVKLKLPSNIKKYLDEQSQQVIYQDQNGNKTKIHPQIELLKIFFYQSLSQKKVHTFQVKKQKLLPFVQDKMMRQCVAITSKRREVQKVNLQRDQNGKMVLSKMARVKPDIKTLISSRSYMLKMLVQKVYTRKQIWGKGKRANTYANILNQKYKSANPQIQQEVIETDESLEFYQSIFHEAYQYYEQEYGKLASIPQQILKSKLYKRSTPQNILKNIFILGISKHNIQFYWLARLMDSLKLPHNWSRKTGKVFDTYTYQPNQLVFDVHPGYIYIFNQMNSFRQFFNKLTKDEQFKYVQNRQMKFYDFFQRPYTVDMYRLIEKEQCKIELIDKKSQRKFDQTQKDFNDWMLIQGMRNSQMKSFAYTLIGKIEMFWKDRNFNEEEWAPSVSPFGDVMWSSTVNNSSINYCPYRQALKNYISIQTQKLPQFKYENFRQSFTKNIIIQNNFIKFKQDNKASKQQQQEFNFIQNLRQDFVEYYINHINLPLAIPYAIQNHFDQESFYDQIFVSPFRLDEGIQFMQFQFQGPLNLQNINKTEQITKKQTKKQQNQAEFLQKELNDRPIWLQMARAKFYIFDLKNKLESQIKNIQQSKSFICQLAIDYITQNQPQRLQQVKQLIRQIKTKQQLIAFIEEIYDVQARQKRKSKYKDVIPQEEVDNDDIFGSEISNLEPEQVKIQSQDENQQNSQDKQNSSQQQPQQNEEISETSSESSQNVQKQEFKDGQNSQNNQEQFEQRQIQQKRQNYEMSPYYEKVDQQTLDLLLRKKIKNKLKKYKFSQKHVKNAVKEFVKLRELYKDQQTVRDIKKNLIITDLKSQTVPYKNTNIVKFQKNQPSRKAFQNLNKKHNNQKQKKLRQKVKQKRDIFTPADIIDKSELFRAYESQMDDYSADEIIHNINEIKSKRLQEERAKQLKRSQEKVIEQENPNDQTQQSIQLQPIMRIKPDIALDPILKHISLIKKVEEFNEFGKTFSKFQKKSVQIKIKKRTKSCQKILKQKQDQTATSSILNKQKSINTSSFSNLPMSNNLKNSKILNSYKSLQKNQILALSNTNNSCFNNNKNRNSAIFNRVCLGNTASKFLGTQSIKSKGQLVVIQARKTLIGKGRGMETYISKKY